MLATSRVDPSVRVRPASVPCERQDRLAESSLQQRLPAQSQPVLRPPSRLPATGGRALPGWGGGPSRCDGPRGAAAAAGWAVRPGSLSRAPRRCNRTPSARPPAPGHLPFTPRCGVERRGGKGLRVPRLSRPGFFYKETQHRAARNQPSGLLSH